MTLKQKKHREKQTSVPTTEQNETRKTVFAKIQKTEPVNQTE